MAIKPCPECGTSIALTAKRCSCGWTEQSKSLRVQPSEHYIARDHQCMWRANGQRCRFPVGFFDLGAVDGYCVFHRNQRSGATGQHYVEMSQVATRSDYLHMASKHVYGEDKPPCSPVTLIEEEQKLKPYNAEETEQAKARCFDTARKLGLLKVLAITLDAD